MKCRGSEARAPTTGGRRPAARRLALLVTFVAACTDDATRTTDADVNLFDAPPSGCSAAVCEPYVCDTRFEKCRTTCEVDAHCVPGRMCRGGACVGDACTEQSPPEVCAPYLCVRGECARDCGASGCAQGYYCRGDTARCVARCVAREDPVCEGYVCDLTVGECEPYCHPGELECAAGFGCTPDGRCAPRE